MKIDYIADWEERLKSRLYQQFRDKPLIETLITEVIAPQSQAVEDVFQALVSLPSIDDSEGAQLDIIGLHVGQPRGGTDDAIYRLYLKARIAANKSTGVPEDLYRVFRAMLGADAGLAYVRLDGDVAALTFRVSDPTVLAPEQQAVALIFLAKAKLAGVKAILEWQETTDALAFCFAGGSGLGFDDAAAPGAGGAFVGAEQAP